MRFATSFGRPVCGVQGANGGRDGHSDQHVLGGGRRCAASSLFLRFELHLIMGQCCELGAAASACGARFPSASSGMPKSLSGASTRSLKSASRQSAFMKASYSCTLTCGLSSGARLTSETAPCRRTSGSNADAHPTCPSCGHVGATTAALPRVLTCSQCGKSALIKQGKEPRSPSLMRDEQAALRAARTVTKLRSNR
jgi:hypothetical protein